MFKRARWVGTGAALGFGVSLWIQHRLKEVAARYRPAGVAGAAAGRARSLPGDVRDAIREGRATMQEREAELRRSVWAAEAAPGAMPGAMPGVVRPLPPPGSASARPRPSGTRRRANRP